MRRGKSGAGGGWAVHLGFRKPRGEVWSSIRIMEDGFREVTRSDRCFARELCLRWSREN